MRENRPSGLMRGGKLDGHWPPGLSTRRFPPTLQLKVVGNTRSKPVTESLARMETRLNWHLFQRCERLRQWIIRIAIAAIIVLGILIWEVAK